MTIPSLIILLGTSISIMTLIYIINKHGDKAPLLFFTIIIFIFSMILIVAPIGKTKILDDKIDIVKTDKYVILLSGDLIKKREEISFKNITTNDVEVILHTTTFGYSTEGKEFRFKNDFKRYNQK